MISRETYAGQYAKEDKVLERIMNEAGFVRHGGEPWHFEFGSEGWLNLMRGAGYIPADSDIEPYERIQPGESSNMKIRFDR